MQVEADSGGVRMPDLPEKEMMLMEKDLAKGRNKQFGARWNYFSRINVRLSKDVHIAPSNFNFP